MYTKRITQLISQTVLCIFLVSALCGCASAHPRSEIDASNIHTCTLTIPGLSRDYDLLFLTDTHIVIPDESAASEIQSYSEERLAHFTGEGGRISSDLFTAWMEYANQMEPDALLLGGDIIDSPSSANVKYLSASLDSLKVPYLYTLGNHDWTFPWDYMTETGTAEYLPLLAPYMETNTAIHTLELDDLIVVAVDNSNNQIHPDALEEYQRILSRKKPVILLLHVPFYTEELLAKTSAVWPNGVVLGGGVHGGGPDIVVVRPVLLGPLGALPVHGIEPVAANGLDDRSYCQLLLGLVLVLVLGALRGLAGIGVIGGVVLLAAGYHRQYHAQCQRER